MPPDGSLHADRCARLARLVEAAQIEAMILTSPGSIGYFSGLQTIQYERLVALAVARDGSVGLVVPSLDADAAEALPLAPPIVTYDARSTGMPELVAMPAITGQVGVEEHHLPWLRAQALITAGLQLRPAAALAMAVRARKDTGELASIRSSVAIVAQVLSEVLATLRVGDTELYVNAAADRRLRELGATDTHPLILFGPNAASPHRAPSNRSLNVGDVVCADLSASINGYWGDLTRCATVGPPDAWAVEAWEIVCRAQDAAVEVMRDGVAAASVDAAQRGVVGAAGAVGTCLHGAGHAIGVDAHEAPFLVPGNHEELLPGMVFTVEPGIYQSGRGGIRLEDHVVVTTGPPEVITALPRELREIEP
jgi:Xaa-Pro dipeptidase